MLDLRIPMGLMFSLVGVILAVYGVLTRGSEIYQRSLGINVNICWGGTLLVFGMAMLALAWWAAAAEKKKE
jgi:hypothetical protein